VASHSSGVRPARIERGSPFIRLAELDPVLIDPAGERYEY
jgi:hypothetical protein